MELEMLPTLFHTLPDSGLLLSNTSSQVNREMLVPKWLSLLTSYWGMIIFNAELKPTISIHT